MARRNRSGKEAAERLQVILYHDRAKLSPGTLDLLKEELVQVIVKHIDVNPEMVSIELSQKGRSQSLVADIPLNN